ncbi:hypothetical protein Tco_1547669, partial [Tanacetum coccineum]
MSIIDDDLFTFEVENSGISNIPCDSNKEDDLEQQMSHETDNDMEYDPSDVEFTEWLALKKFNYMSMDHYTKKAVWNYWIRGDDEVELTDKESSDSDGEDEFAKIFRIENNVFNFETPLCKVFKEFNYLLQIDPDVLTKNIEGFKTYDDYKDDWIYEWNKDVPWSGLPVAGEMMDILIELKEEALKNKAIMEGMIADNDESSNEGWRRRDNYEITNHDNEYENEHDEEYVAVKEGEYEDLTNTSEDACRAYQEIFRMMGQGWM